jgi:hypothetical protein
MLQAGFEPTIPASDQLQTLALDSPVMLPWVNIHTDFNIQQHCCAEIRYLTSYHLSVYVCLILLYAIIYVCCAQDFQF